MPHKLKCDAEGCDHIEDVDGDLTQDHVGKPCPKCGANLLTQEDFDLWNGRGRVIRGLMTSVNDRAIERIVAEGVLTAEQIAGISRQVFMRSIDGQLAMSVIGPDGAEYPMGEAADADWSSLTDEQREAIERITIEVFAEVLGLPVELVRMLEAGFKASKAKAEAAEASTTEATEAEGV